MVIQHYLGNSLIYLHAKAGGFLCGKSRRRKRNQEPILINLTNSTKLFTFSTWCNP